MKDRIKKIMDYDGLNAAQFATKVKINPSALSHILNGKNFPSYEAVQKIIACYPSVQIDWLMTGNGSMLKDGESPSVFGDLFDENPIISPEVENKPKEETEKASNKPVNPRKVTNIQIDKSVKSRSGFIKKVVIFYSDNTYEEFVSANSPDSL